MSTISISVRNVYGVERIYPANAAAEALARIAGTKTLSHANIRDARALGHAIEAKHDNQVSDLLTKILND